MSKKVKKVTTITRKKEKVIGDLTDAQKFKVLWMYAHNESYEDICSSFNLNKERTHKWIHDFTTAIDRRKELHYLTSGKGTKDVSLPESTSKAITQEFLSLLSDEDDDMLNEREHIYVQEWVQYGNNGKALTSAKLDGGVNERGITANKMLKVARGQFLRRREKIKLAIEKEEGIMLGEMASSKEFLQKSLIQSIRSLQEDADENGSNRNNLLKSLEMLGKTIPGSFTETVRTEEVSPKDTLTLLMKKVQESKGSEDTEKVTYHAE